MSQWSKQVIDAVWCKGRIVAGYDSNQWRADRYNNWIGYAQYGTTGNYGWEIDHVNPKSKGGSDSLYNLQPLHWEANRKLGAKS